MIGDGPLTDCNAEVFAMVVCALDTVDDGFIAVCGAGFEETAKASSASLSVTRCSRPREGEGGRAGFASKSNWPPSCKSENWSKLGKRFEISSTCPL